MRKIAKVKASKIKVALILIALFGGFLFTQAAVKKSLPSLKAQAEEIILPVILPDEDYQDEQPKEDFVDPREIKDVLRQMNDLKREINRVRKMKGIVAEQSAKLNELLGLVDQYSKNIKKPPVDMSQREVLQEFYDAQLWDELNVIRVQVEFPREKIQITKEIKRVEGLLKGKIVKKALQSFDISIDKIKADIDAMKVALQEAQNAFDAGDPDEINTALEPIREGSHPGEINCVVNSFRDMNRGLSQIKNSQIKEMIKSAIEPIIDEIEESDYRSACRDLNDMRKEFETLMMRAGKMRGIDDPKIEKMRQQLEQLIEKLESEEPTEKDKAEFMQ